MKYIRKIHIVWRFNAGQNLLKYENTYVFLGIEQNTSTQNIYPKQTKQKYTEKTLSQRVQSRRKPLWANMPKWLPKHAKLAKMAASELFPLL